MKDTLKNYIALGALALGLGTSTLHAQDSIPKTNSDASKIQRTTSDVHKEKYYSFNNVLAPISFNKTRTVNAKKQDTLNVSTELSKWFCENGITNFDYTQGVTTQYSNGDVHLKGLFQVRIDVNDNLDNILNSDAPWPVKFMAANAADESFQPVEIKKTPQKEEKETPKRNNKKSDAYFGVGYAYNYLINNTDSNRKNNGTLLVSLGTNFIKGLNIEGGITLGDTYGLSTSKETILDEETTNSGRTYVTKNILNKDRSAVLSGHVGLSQAITNKFPMRIGAYVLLGKNDVFVQDFNREEVYFNGEQIGEGNSINQLNYSGSQNSGLIQGYGGFLQGKVLGNLELRLGAAIINEYVPNKTNLGSYDNAPVLQAGLIYNVAGKSRK